jgi:hypothetical protein
MSKWLQFVDYYDNGANHIRLNFYLSTSIKMIQTAINATKSNSGIVRRAIKTMGWSIVAYPKVLALVGVLGNTSKRFIL